MAKEYKKLVYKIVAGTAKGETFQDALLKALGHRKSAKHRVQSLGSDGSHLRFINSHRPSQAMTLGIFHRLTKGAGQYVIDMTTAANDWPVQLVTARTDKEKIQEFIEGTLFFAVWRNHLILHQPVACPGEQFRDYCSWLLSRGAEKPVDPDDGPVTMLTFSDPLPPNLRAVSKTPVRTVRFASSITTKVSNPSKSESKAARIWFTPTGEAWNGLRAILRSIRADIPDDMLYDEALGDGDLQVGLELKCTQKKAQSTAGQVLTALGKMVSDSDADKFEVVLTDGTKIRQSEMKVETVQRVECVQKQPVPEQLFKCMVEWMAELVDNNTVVEEKPFSSA